MGRPIGLRNSDYRAMIEFLAQSSSAQTMQQLRSSLLEGLLGLLGADESSYTELSLRPAGVRCALGYPTPAHTIPGALDVLKARIREHPIASSVLRGDDSARRLSDVMPAGSFERSGFCQDFFKRRGVRHGVYAVVGRSADSVGVVGVLRTQLDFSIRDRDILELVSKPLAGMWAQARARDHLAREWRAISATHAVDRSSARVQLTPAENGVVALVTAGFTNNACAAALGVSVKAVEQHLTHVYRKLGVASRTQLMLRIPRDVDH